MTQREQAKAAAEFAAGWADRGDEKQETARFWIQLLQDVLGVSDAASRIEFEKPVRLTHTSYIDAYIPETKVLIEQKSAKIDLHKAYAQSDGAELTPFEQAKRYVGEMKASEKPRWIVVCNFREFLVYDLEEPSAEPQQILLSDLPKEFYRLQFLVDQRNENIRREEEISLAAGRLVGKLYDALYGEYAVPEDAANFRTETNPRGLSPSQLRALNILCVRIVFCLYAEDAGLFATKTAFEDYIKSFATENLRGGIISLFKALDTTTEERDKYDTKLHPFPYVNGGLFRDEQIEIPNFTQEIVDAIVNHCAPFNWSEISPTIFGAVFESTLNPETRRTGGMHYTSVANIHKVIDPLFMDDLNAEFEKICAIKTASQRNEKLTAFQKKLGSLTFLDPACGSGNFLTETYLSLRRLENKAVSLLNKGERVFGFDEFICVKISQFYGIEINDFAVTVAKTALWIAESQMVAETEAIVSQTIVFLPLTNHANIIEGNALRMDWATLAEEEQPGFLFTEKLNVYKIDEHFGEISVRDSGADMDDTSLYRRQFKEMNVIAKEIEEKKLPEPKKQKRVTYSYIIGNPPFSGYGLQTDANKRDTLSVYVDENGRTYRAAGKIDYVANWYFKAAEQIQGTQTRCAFVSTNSITQGEQVSSVWKPIFERFNLRIDFAYQTFRWYSESNDMAHVHCVIIGFSNALSAPGTENRIFLADGTSVTARHISPYLRDEPAVWIENRATPLCDAPRMTTGNRPADGGHLIIEADEYEAFIQKEPAAKKWIKRLTGAEEYINNKERWCLWLVGASPAEIKDMKEVYKRVQLCREDRLRGAEDRQKLADTPTIFREINNPEQYLIVPRVSSERRKYIPIGFLHDDTIPTDSATIITHAERYHFGVLTSLVHMAWMRAVAGRLKSDYRYSKEIVYNNFPWCEPTDAQKAKIEQTAQAILDTRAKYPDSSLADLYDETLMPNDLRKAHAANDKAVMTAYGFAPKLTEAEIVAELFALYGKMAG